MKSKKILITGAGGFIGSHLVEQCVKEGYQVVAFVRYKSDSSWGWLDKSDVKKEIEVFAGDIRDFDAVHKAMDGCDTVFHLAALIGIPYSYVSPLAYIRTNIEGTYNILEAAKSKETPNILITSTSETYGSAQYVPIDENHPLVGQSPYSASKIGADQLAISYFRSFDMPVKIVRPFNTFGPRQSARAIIPTVISQIIAGENSLKLGNVTPTRDLTFVKDTANGFLEISKNELFNGKATNIGTGKEISVENLVNLIAKLIGKDISIVTDNQRIRPKNSEVDRLVCDNTNILTNTAWMPRFSIDDGLRETIEFIRQNKDRYKHDRYNV